MTKFYLNPITGRVIKSTGKTYEKLRQDGYIPDKEKCLYNIKSAKKCLERLFRYYPDMVYPSSSFINIPKTYREGKARAFIQCQASDKIVGYVDKKGNINRLMDGIAVPSGKKVPVVKDPLGGLESALKGAPQVSEEVHHKIKEQVESDKLIVDPKKASLIFNPVQGDFIPVNKPINKDTQKEIVNTINDTLVPTTMPPILPVPTTGSVAGVIEEGKKVIGVVNTDNKLIALREPKDVKNIQTIPKVEIAKEEFEKHSVVPEKGEERIIRQEIRCMDGEMFDTHEQRCLPCEHYDLVWDPKYKSCKIGLKLIAGEGGEIIGYSR